MKPHKRLLGAALLFIVALTGLALWLVHVNAPPTAIAAVTAWHLASRLPEWALEVRASGGAPVGLPAFAFRLDDAPLRDAMDQALQTDLGSDGHTERGQRFGFASDEMPPDMP